MPKVRRRTPAPSSAGSHCLRPAPSGPEGTTGPDAEAARARGLPALADRREDDALSWLDGGQEHRGPLSPLGRSQAGRGRRPWILGIAAVGAVALVAGLAGLAVPSRTGRAGGRTPANARRTAGGRSAPADRSQGAATASFPPADFSAADPPPAWSGPLPYPLLIADRGDHRLVEVSPAGSVLWQYPAAPAGAAATAVAWSVDGTGVFAVGETQGVVEEVDMASGRVLWQYGAGAQSLNHPTAVAPAPGGDVLVADTRDCRLLTVSPAGRVVATWGAAQSGYCTSDPAAGRLGYPESVDAVPGGDWLVGLAANDQIALLDASGRPVWSEPAPPLGGGFVVDATAAPGGLVVVTGFSNPGTVTEFDPGTGAVLWTYAPPAGPGALDNPRAALVLPNGDVAIADTGHDRVLVVDPSTGRVVWQYGGAGRLSAPSGLALDVWRNWKA